MRPGQANKHAGGLPAEKSFFQHFSRTQVGRNNDIQCCLYRAIMGNKCLSSDWRDSNTPTFEIWDRSDEIIIIHNGDEIGMLLDLDDNQLLLGETVSFRFTSCLEHASIAAEAFFPTR